MSDDGRVCQTTVKAYFGDECREATRWFPAIMSRILLKNTFDRVDNKSLTAYIEDRKGYDYSAWAIMPI